LSIKDHLRRPPAIQCYRYTIEIIGAAVQGAQDAAGIKVSIAKLIEPAGERLCNVLEKDVNIAFR